MDKKERRRHVMVLQWWYPMRELRRMEGVVDRAWRGFGSGYGETQTEGWGIPLDVVEKEGHIVIQASVPGISPGDINVTVEDGLLALTGHTHQETEGGQPSYLIQERRSGTFSRSLRLPDTVDAEKATSSYANGTLTVSFPKLEGKRPQKITVEVPNDKAA
jgi:HSP20 family protein